MSKLKSLLAEARKAKKKADYLGSRKGLAKETIKGMPAAARKMLRRLTGTKYGKGQDERTKKQLERALENEKDETRKAKLRKMLEEYN